MKEFCLRAVLIAALAMPGAIAKAQTLTPDQQAVVGTWDFHDGGICEVRIEKGKLYGKIIHTDKKVDNGGVCKKCEGALKNKPFVGMDWLYGFTPEGTTPKWGGGAMVDYATGILYRGKIWTEDGGKTLNVRGYVGNPILGQTIVWKRIK